MTTGRKRRGVAATAALAALAACVAALFSFRASPPAVRRPAARARLHPIVLANRTIATASFGAPSVPSALSPRGTAAYALACAVPVTDDLRADAASFGARVVGYLPRQALLVEAAPSAIREALADPRFAGAAAYLPSDKVRAGVKGGRVTVTPLAECDRAALAEFIEGRGGAVEMSGPSLRGSFGATVSDETLAALAGRGDVLWIDRRVQPRLVNDLSVNFTGVADARGSLGLTGRGQVIATADSGLDSGDLETVHGDFTNRIVALVNLGGCTTADYNGHGTHTAGTIGGSGALSGGTYRGVAFEAGLYVQACGTNSIGMADIHFANAETYDDIFAAGIPSGAYIHSDSWGGSYDGLYEESCEGADGAMWRNPGLLVVMAAGNGGRKGTSTICPPGVAKNVLTVGNSESPRSAAWNMANPASSRGPCADGRIKPDVMAPGTQIVSCRSVMRPGLPKFESLDGYTSMSGSSMSAPHAAGCAALVRQWLVERPGHSGDVPSGALVKAILVGGAREMGLDQTVQGFGLIDVAESLAPSNRCVKLCDKIPFSSGSRSAWSFTLTNAAPFEALLAWTDYPATPSAGAAIVNDLDLVVVCKTTGEVWYGNGVEGGDRTNTVEAVRIASAAPGEYRVMVAGEDVPHSYEEGGAAALYVRGAFNEGDCEEETVPGRIVSVSVAGPPSLVREGLSPAAGDAVATYDFGTVLCTAPRFMAATNANGTAVSLHALEGWTVEGADSLTVSDGGSDVALAIVATNDVSVTWRYGSEPSSYALRCILSAEDSYASEGSTCYISSHGNELSNRMAVAEEWVGNGGAVAVDLPGEVLLDEFGFDTLYRRSASGGVSTQAVSPPFVLKLGAVELAETDGTAAFATNSLGAMPASLEFAMDGPKDVIGHYWSVDRTVEGASMPYWWYMRNLGCAGAGGEEFRTDDGDPDGDGFGNLSEYGEGTLPLDPMSFPFRVISFSPTNIAWLGSKTASYAVESAVSPERAAAWAECASVPPSGSVTNSARLSPAQPGASRFFRVRAR